MTSCFPPTSLQAQFEFGNARPGTCFDSVCVLTNLPKVSLERTDELIDLLSAQLFKMVGNPVQVVVPSLAITSKTKGYVGCSFLSSVFRPVHRP